MTEPQPCRDYRNDVSDCEHEIDDLHRRFAIIVSQSQPLQGWDWTTHLCRSPGFQSKPWAGISQRLRRKDLPRL